MGGGGQKPLLRPRLKVVFVNCMLLFCVVDIRSALSIGKDIVQSIQTLYNECDGQDTDEEMDLIRID